MLLSVLIPAYQFADGVARILNGMAKYDCSEIEIIIFDDSVDDLVEKLCLARVDAFCGSMRYLHNRPSLGAVANWNALLASARGEYCLLLHHDEFPIGDHFIPDLIVTLRNHPDTDVVMLDCVLVAPKTGRNRRHLPMGIRALIVNYFPLYLYRRNVVGPTAAFVVRRSIYSRFDERLQWLVDVDVYVRSLRLAKRLLLCPNIKIGSLLGRTDSITARLKSSIPRVAEEERAYLRERYGNSFWFGPCPQELGVQGVLRLCDTVCWWAMRFLIRMASRFLSDPVSRSEALRAMHGHQVL